MSNDDYCVRCGWCCLNRPVMIPKPGVAQVSARMTTKRVEEKYFMLKPSGIPCPHLRWEKSGDAACGIHDLPIFKRTNCYLWRQVGEDGICQIGHHVLDVWHQPIRERCHGQHTCRVQA